MAVEYLPMGHMAHVAELLAPESRPNVPAPQGVHAMIPTSAAPLAVPYVPTEQLAHEAAEADATAVENVPATHSWHGAIAPSVDANVPAAHATHACAPVDET